MRRSFLVVLGASASLSTLAGCDNVQDSIKEHGPKARAVVTQVTAIAKDLETRPALVGEGKPITVPAGTILDTSTHQSDSNALIVHYEDLQRPGELGNVAIRVKGSHHFSECVSFLDHRTYPWNPKEPNKWTESLGAWNVADRLKECGRTKVVFVVRTMAYASRGRARFLRRPDVPLVVPISDAGTRDAGTKDAGGDGGAKANDGGIEAGTPAVTGPAVDYATCTSAEYRCVYEPAYVKAEIHVFTLDPVTHQGAFAFEAETKAFVVTSEPYPTEDPTDLQAVWDSTFPTTLSNFVPMPRTVLQ